MARNRPCTFHVGLDYPDLFGFWEMNELIVATTCFMLFILMQTIFMGMAVTGTVLYLLQKYKDHRIRGKQDHFLWKIGLITQKGFSLFPPSSAVSFEP